MRRIEAIAEIDGRIIRALHKNGRASIQSLSTALGVSRTIISTRLHALRSSGTIRIIAAVDPGFLGHHVLAHVSIETAGSIEPIAQRLLEANETVLVSVIGGQYALAVEVWAGSMPELYDLLERFRAIPNVNGINTLTYSEIIKGVFVSNSSGDITLDEIDLTIIKLLQTDARVSFRVLSDSVHLSPSAVTTRVNRLIKHRVIRISVVEARGFSNRQLSVGVGLKLHSMNDTVVEALRADETIDFAARTIGRFDAVVTIVESTAAALYQSLERLRSFEDLASLECWTHLTVLKEDYSRVPRLIKQGDHSTNSG